MADIAQLGIEIDTRKLKSGEKDLASFASSAADVTKATDIAKGAIAGMVAAAAGVMTLSKSIDTLVSFSREMAALTAVTKASESQMKALSKQAQTLGAVTAYGANDAAAAQKFLAQAGLSVNEVISATPSVLQLAQAGMLDLGTAAELATDIMSQMGLGVQDLNRINDVLVQTANSATTDVSQLAEAFSYAGPIAKNFGLSLETTSAALGVISSAGIKASRAGTGFVGFLASANALTPQAEKRLLRYGVTFDKLNVQLRGLIPVLQTLSDANISASDAIEIFGRESASSTMALVSHVSTLKQYTSELRSSQGVAAEAANIMSNDLGSAFSSFSSSIDGIIIKLGEDQGLTSELKRIIDTASGVINVFSGMETEFASSAGYGDEFLVTVRGIADAIEALSIVFAGRLIGSMLTSRAAMAAFTGIVSLYSAATRGATVVTDVHGMAISRTSAIANTAKIAMAGLNTVMGLMGGPLGVITLAASALLAWKNYADEADQEARNFASGLDITTESLRSLTVMQLKAAGIKLKPVIEEQSSAVKDQQEKVDSLRVAIKYHQASMTAWGQSSELSQKQIDELTLAEADLETKQATLSATQSKAIAINQALYGNLRDNYVALNNQSSATGILIGMQTELNKVLGQQPKTTGAPSLIVSDGAPAKPAVAPVSSIKSTATNKLEDQKKAAAEYLTEVSRFNATEAQQIQNWQADQLTKLESFHAQGLVKESEYQWGKQAIIDESNRRLQKLNDDQWSEYLNGSSAALLKLKQQAQTQLTGPKQQIVVSGIDQKLKEQTSSGLPTIDGGAQSNEQNQIAQLQTQTTAMNDAYNQRIEDYKLYRASEVENAAYYDSQIAALEAKKKANNEAAQAAMLNLQLSAGESMAASAADSFKSILGEQSAAYQTMFAVQKAFSIAQSMIAIQTGIAMAAANPWPLNIGAMASVAAATANIVSSIMSVASPSFDGGGYTGNGSRSGGLDGKGGFWAMMHPQETVIDHTKSNGSVSSGSSGGGNVTVNVSLQETSDTSQQGTTSQTTGDDGSVQINVFVADIRSEGSMAQVLERTYGLSRMGA